MRGINFPFSFALESRERDRKNGFYVSPEKPLLRFLQEGLFGFTLRRKNVRGKVLVSGEREESQQVPEHKSAVKSRVK